MGGTDSKPTPSPTPLIPQTGAAQYWYVDPRSDQQSSDFVSIPNTPSSTEMQQLEEALRRIGVLPANTNPSF